MREYTVIPTLKELLTYNPDLKACFFDMDGTLFNTEHLHKDSVRSVIKGHMKEFIDPEALWSLCYGQTDSRVYSHLERNYGLKLSLPQFLQRKAIELDRLIDDIERTDPLVMNPRLPTLLKQLQLKGIKCYVVTSSERVTAHRCLEKLDIKFFFEKVITTEDTQKHKPHPAPYLLALDFSKRNSNEIIIFEDSLIGLAAAQNVTQFIIKASWY
jgi:HAD superfamily hydrolase (TIGR01509 family)